MKFTGTKALNKSVHIIIKLSELTVHFVVLDDGVHEALVTIHKGDEIIVDTFGTIAECCKNIESCLNEKHG